MKRPMFESQEAKLLAWVQMREKNVVKTGEVAEALDLSKRQEERILSRLAVRGMIVRLKRGVYLVPSKLPLGGKWSPSDAAVLAELMNFYGGQYQLTGLQVFNRYRFTTQIANQVAAYNDKISGRKKIGGIVYEFIKVPARRLGGIELVPSKDAPPIHYPTLGRALFDAVYDWDRFNSLPRAYDWIKHARKNRKVMFDLVEAALSFGNSTTCRRLGYWLETLKIDPKLVNRLLKSVRRTQSFAAFLPTRPLRGQTNRRWGLIING